MSTGAHSWLKVTSHAQGSKPQGALPWLKTTSHAQGSKPQRKASTFAQTRASAKAVAPPPLHSPPGMIMCNLSCTWLARRRRRRLKAARFKITRGVKGRGQRHVVNDAWEPEPHACVCILTFKSTSICPMIRLHVSECSVAGSARDIDGGNGASSWRANTQCDGVLRRPC